MDFLSLLLGPKSLRSRFKDSKRETKEINKDTISEILFLIKMKSLCSPLSLHNACSWSRGVLALTEVP
jgi:hypothetical protein